MPEPSPDVPKPSLDLAEPSPDVADGSPDVADASPDVAEPALVAGPPNYADPANWRRQSPMNGYGPYIAEEASALKPVDVFFLYPSTFFPPPLARDPTVPESWNQTIAQAQVDPGIEAQVFSKAGVFAKAGTNIYAPFYRQAAGNYVLPALLWRQNDRNIPAAKMALDVAYNDIKLAFLHYINVLNPKPARRPFILAGHSQGSNLLLMLLQDKDFTPEMRAQMVAAYVIGWSVTSDDIADTVWEDHGICNSKSQNRCIVTYNTQQDEGDFSMAHSSPGNPGAGIPGTPPQGIVRKNAYSVNPLTWVANGPKDSDTGFKLGITEESEPAFSAERGGARFFRLNSVRPGKWTCAYDLRPQLGQATQPLCLTIPIAQDQCCTKYLPASPLSPSAVQPSWAADAIGGWYVFHSDLPGFTAARNALGALVVDPNGFVSDPPGLGNYKNLNAPYNTNDNPTGVNAADPKNQAPGWYHNYDYAFFWKNLEQNVIDRIEAYAP